MNNIVNKSFINELEKNAQIMPLILKATKWLGSAAKELGTAGKLEGFSTKALKAFRKGEGGKFMSQYSAPIFNKTIATVNTSTKDTGFIQNHITDAYNYSKGLSKGVSTRNTLTTNAKTIAKNFINEEKQLYSRGKYKIINKDNNKIKYYKNNEELTDTLNEATHIKQRFMPKRKITGKVYNENGEIIGSTIKKLAPIRMLNYSLTPTGMLGTGTAMSLASGENLKDSLKNGITDSWKWTPATKLIGLGDAAKSSYDLLKNI